MIERAELAARVHTVYERIVVSSSGLVIGEKPGCVDGAVGAALNGALYAEPDRDEPDPLHIASFLLRSLVMDHCFTDGNKRTGWASAIDYLYACGFGISVDQNEAAQFVESIAAGAVTEPREIALWFAERLSDISLAP